VNRGLETAFHERGWLERFPIDAQAQIPSEKEISEMGKIASGLWLSMCVLGALPIVVRTHSSHSQLLAGAAMKMLLGFVFLSVSTCPVKGQTEPSSQSNLPDNPASKSLGLDKNESKSPARESLQVVPPTNSDGKPRKFTTTTKLWVASSLAVYTAAALDMRATEETVQRINRLHKQYPGFPEDYSFESNPFARPLLKLPAPAYYACGVALATGVNWVGLRMSRSKRFRRAWWLPQTLSVAGNTHGYLSFQ
jgi:hypothetical protein